MMNNSHTGIIEEINQKIAVSEQDRDYLLDSFHRLTKEKSELLIRAGGKAQNLYFIVSGYLRCFYTDEEGDETTTEILSSHDFITSFESFLHGTASKLSIQCLTPCELLSISKKDYDSLYTQVLSWPIFCQSVYEKHILRMTKRMHILQNLSASRRYEELLNAQPGIALHTPVKHLASYLGIKPQSLSRIRANIK